MYNELFGDLIEILETYKEEFEDNLEDEYDDEEEEDYEDYDDKVIIINGDHIEPGATVTIFQGDVFNISPGSGGVSIFSVRANGDVNITGHNPTTNYNYGCGSSSYDTPYTGNSNYDRYVDECIEEERKYKKALAAFYRANTIGG